ncbi:hypothetical protein [Streptomyces sp. NPDC055105]|uniref:hypothetical protein n=1 Tax=Streptomyces sp. NPDC055105 TaxID=3365719 RepID=UPI0037D17A29
MSTSAPRYLGIKGTDGEGWKVLVWGDPDGELAKIQSRIEAGEVFTSVTVDTSGTGSTREVTLDSPVASCELLPLKPTAIKVTVAREQGDRHTFTTEK